MRFSHTELSRSPFFFLLYKRHAHQLSYSSIFFHLLCRNYNFIQLVFHLWLYLWIIFALFYFVEALMNVLKVICTIVWAVVLCVERTPKNLIIITVWDLIKLSFNSFIFFPFFNIIIKLFQILIAFRIQLIISSSMTF